MLPGGLDIVGLYITLSSNELNSASTQGKLKSILLSVHKKTSKYLIENGESLIEKIILNYDPQTMK